jgi:hypothetical protein
MRKTQDAKAVDDELQANKMNGFAQSEDDADRIAAIGKVGEF